MRTTAIIAFLGVAHAAFDNCDRPVAQWAGLNQAEGNGGVYTAKYHDGSVYIGGYQDGKYAFHSQHITTGATGTHGNDHTAVQAQHDAETFDDDDDHDVKTWSPSNQNGRDAVITKISEGGVYEGIFAVDTLPVDGKYDDTSLNSGWGGWSWISDMDDFAESGDEDTMIAAGVFRGKLTFPVAQGAEAVTLENPKWKKYDGFITKFNVKTHTVVWATAEKIQKPSCNGNTDGTPDKECDEPTTLPGAVATTAAGHVVTTSNWCITCSRNTDTGRLLLFNGGNGANVWEKDYGTGNMLFGVATIGEVAYVTGHITGVDIDPFQTGTKVTTGTSSKTSSKGGETEVVQEESAVVAALDATAGGSGATKWAINFGIGSANSIVADPTGTHLYVGGKLEPAADVLTGATAGKYTINALCSLTGKHGGFLVKLVAETGECLWAADTPAVGTSDTRFGFRNHGLDIDAAGAYLYVVKSGSAPMKFDDDHTVPIRGKESDGFLAKYSCEDGTGQWIQSIGGQGSDTLTDVVTTPNGVLVAGYSKSSEVSLAGVTIANLQHQRASAADGTSNPSAGHQAHFAMMIHAEERLSCLKNCPSGSTTDAEVKEDFCVADGTCMSKGAFSEFQTCFQCKPDVSASELQGPILTNHCYIDNVCVAEGSGAPRYERYGVDSVCETCQPAKHAYGWSVKSGFFHDRVSASDRNKHSNDYGIYFHNGQNGCQVLPDIQMPPNPKASLTTALANPTSSSIADIGARATSAISAATSADGSNQGVEIAWGWYHGNSATCIKSAGAEVASGVSDVCKNTPAELSDTMAQAFETNLYYGHSIARVKVQQGLAILQSDLVTPSTDRTIDDLKTDVLAHMLIPYYQGAIHAAHQMDNGPDKAVAQANGAAYWKVIDQAIQGDGIAPSDRAHLTALFAPEAAPSGNLNFCTVKELLLRNLPQDTDLKYSSKPWVEGQMMGERGRAVPCSGNCGKVDVVKHTEDDATRHVTKADVGVLKGSEEQTCDVLAMPPPSPPLPLPPLKGTSDSGLSDGEIAGVAIGAAVGGIVLLTIVGLILRSLIVKDAKPVFTCLEKAPADTKSPA